MDVRTQIKQAFMYAKNVLCRRVDVVDNLTSTSTDLPLSANMGKALKDSLLDLTYPVGSIYMSVNNTNPSLLFGGIWVEWGSGQVYSHILPVICGKELNNKMRGVKK